MRIFNCLHRRPFEWLLRLFIVAVFADVANIPDIFVDQSILVEHDDEGAPISLVTAQAQSTGPCTSRTQIAAVASGVIKAPRVIYDVDSPSLPPLPSHPFVSIRGIANKCVIQLLSPFFVENLYLRNSSLLI
jgi:hypothetical protein